MNTGFPILSVLIWLPIIAAVVCLPLQASVARVVAFLAMVVSTILCIFLVTNFDTSTYSMQFVELRPWLPDLDINYELGIDGLSLSLILLTTVTTLIVLLATWRSIQDKVSQYLANFLVLQGLTVGMFAATNAILFYILWEATLIPMFLIIGVWGSSNRTYAAIKFFLYTFLGSAIMLAGLLYLGYKAEDFSIMEFYGLKLDLLTQKFLFIAFFLAFAIKIPMWPVHTWLPDAHTEAPAGGSIMLAAIMLKMGAYGFLRFTLPIVPDACRLFAPLMIALSLIAIVYIGFVAIVQTDVKRLIAYSSISHMGFVTLGCFILYPIFHYTAQKNDAGLALEGAIMVMISHGFVSGALFAGIGYIYDRLHTRDISNFGGVVNTMPIFASFFLLFGMANAGLPGTSGFVGEFMVILGSLKAGFWISFTAALTLILGAAYTLWMYKRVFWGDVSEYSPVAKLEDIRGTEIAAFALFALGVIILGVYPKPLLDLLHATTGHLLVLSTESKLGVM